jgi:hypothetical protein
VGKLPARNHVSQLAEVTQVMRGLYQHRVVQRAEYPLRFGSLGRWLDRDFANSASILRWSKLCYLHPLLLLHLF